MMEIQEKVEQTDKRSFLVCVMREVRGKNGLWDNPSLRGKEFRWESTCFLYIAPLSLSLSLFLIICTIIHISHTIIFTLLKYGIH
jgi:hypothetical protein